jgi:hypothetical protein
MTTSESTKEISAALVGFHKEVGKIAKDAKNPFFKSKYASLSGILDTISEPLVNNGLSVVQFPEGENGLTTRLTHTSGEWMESTYTMKPVKDTPQDRGSAITYQRRYAIGAILSLNIDEDDDANKASGREVQKAVNGAKNAPDGGEKLILFSLLNTSSLEEGTEDYKKAFNAINSCQDYETYQKLEHRLQDLQKEAVNLSQKDIAKKVNKSVNHINS